MIDLDRLDELAKAATGEDWSASYNPDLEAWCVLAGKIRNGVGMLWNVAIACAGKPSKDNSENNALYIAAVSPDVWLEASAEIRELRRFKEDTLTVRKLILEEKVNRALEPKDE
jgi:hypothetical protein